MNRMDEMLQEDKTALELDPFARPWMYGYALIRARRFDEAVKELKQRIEARPGYPLLHAILCDAYLGKGDYPNAIEEVKKTLVIEGDEQGAKNIDKAYRNGDVLGALFISFDDQRLFHLLDSVRVVSLSKLGIVKNQVQQRIARASFYSLLKLFYRFIERSRTDQGVAIHLGHRQGIQFVRGLVFLDH